MGKGRIVSHIGDGLYNVELLHNRDRIEAELQALGEQLAQIEGEITKLETEREPLVEDRNWIATQIDQAVANAEEGEVPDVEALLVELAQVSAQIQQLDVRIAMMKGRRLEATKRKQMLESVPADPVQTAWCADYTEDLAGEVATVEVPAEGVVGQFLTWRRMQIRPGHNGGAAYSAARDGQMFHREGQAGYQAYFNAAILPGVQKWRPQYRVGVITSIDRAADTCNLDIVSEFSSAQDLFLNQSFTRENVPIQYMTCDSQVFEAGDRVLVEFTGRDWNAPKVIGFEQEPKQCGLLVGFFFAYEIFLFPPSTSTIETCGPNPGYTRDNPITGLALGRGENWGKKLIWERNLEQAEAATWRSELPSPDGEISDPLGAFITKCSFDTPLLDSRYRSATVRVFDNPVRPGYLSLRPMPPHVVAPDSIQYTLEEYAAVTRGWFALSETQCRYYWSDEIDTGALLGSCTATFDISEFPETVTYNDQTFYRNRITAFVAEDFDPPPAPADISSPVVLIRYDRTPPE